MTYIYCRVIKSRKKTDFLNQSWTFLWYLFILGDKGDTGVDGPSGLKGKPGG